MLFPEKYDKLITGIISALLLPLITAFLIFLFAKGNPTPGEWLAKISDADIVTHIISLCVFPNVFAFLVFNYYDMLRASKGVLGITIIWALIVFAVKLLL